MKGPVRRAVVLDDDQFTRALVAGELQAWGFETRTTSTAFDALAEVERFDADIIVADLDLGPGPTGADVIAKLRRDSPWVAIVILTTFRSPRLVSPEQLPADIPYVVKSDLRSAEVFHTAVEAALSDAHFAVSTDTTRLTITPKQADVLRLIAQGLSNERISEHLQLSLRAVEQTVRRLYQRLGIAQDKEDVNPRVQAVRMYQEGNITVRGRR